jgi:hypothetical protein
MTAMRYSIAVDRLRSVAETCTRLASLWEDDPLIVDAYVFGELLEGGQRPERLQMAFVVDLPPEEVTWYTLPTPMVGFAATVGIDLSCGGRPRPALPSGQGSEPAAAREGLTTRSPSNSAPCWRSSVNRYSHPAILAAATMSASQQESP